MYSYYYVCVTMNTVGYGDIIPQNNLEVFYSIFFIYIACGMFGYSLTSIGLIVQDINKKNNDFSTSISIINEYMQRQNIKYDLRMRIRKYVQFLWKEEEQEKKDEENKIVNKLSKSLRGVFFLNY